ncbi:MAG: DUF3795 domain-containing protein [Clostridia bacterium]|nr:DUF3795 domain-containing protein [Clostridia bacterium]
MENPICYCGHDCARCITYLATIKNDAALRQQAREFYKDEFSIDVSIEDIHCLGGRSDDVFFLCKECPWAKCCRERGIDSCTECEVYPCKVLTAYSDKYVNKCNQV